MPRSIRVVTRRTGDWLVGGFALLACSLSPPAAAQQYASFGERIFQQKAECTFCHGRNGDGRGDPRAPGSAANLHKTELSRADLVEVIACGRPGTAMPHFDKDAWTDYSCFGMSAKDVGGALPQDPMQTSLTRREIEGVVDYVLGTFAGK